MTGTCVGRVRALVGRSVAADVGFLAALFVFVALAYAPSLKHPPRADQWCYLVDTAADHSFLDALKNSYSYNRTRQTAPGDTDLFRPVLFAILAAEKTAFEGHVAPVQAVGIVLHCAVCALMLVFIRQVAGAVRPTGAPPEEGPAWFAYATVAFFALNPCVQDLVIWAHLHGYLLFLLLVLGSMNCLLRYAVGTAGGISEPRYLWAAWALALVSAFTYELGQFYACLAGVAAAVAAAPRVGVKRALVLAVAFASIGAVYQAANRTDQEQHRGRYRPDDLRPEIVRAVFTRATVEHSARYGVYTAVQPFFPSIVETGYSGQRLQIAETVWSGRRLKVLTPVLAVSVGVFGALAALAVAGLWRLARDGSRAKLIALVLPASLSALYGAITVLGRMNMRPDIGITSNSYYAYTALAFALLAASAAWHAVGGWGVSVRRGVAVGLLVLSALGAEHVWAANVMIAKSEKDWTRALGAVQRFVDERRDEHGFSFEIEYGASDHVPSVHNTKITRIVFDRWMSDPDPKYTVTIRGGRAHAVLRE